MHHRILKGTPEEFNVNRINNAKINYDPGGIEHFVYD
jgi:hypothetical protein